MDSTIQLLASGIAIGFIYCLVAIEATLIWNATGLLNFAHDRFITLGAFFFGGTMIRAFGGNFVAAFAGTTIFMALFGIVFATIILNPLRNMPSRIFAMTGAILFGFILRELLRMIYGPSNFTVQDFFTGRITVGNTVLPEVYVLIVFISILLIIAQALFFTKTKAGKAVRCVAQDKECAAIMGVNVKRNIALSVAISAIICGWIGMMVIPLFAVDHNMSSMIGMKGFCAAVVGGFGTYGGAIAGGLFIGIIENIYLMFGPAIYKDVVAFMMMILFIMIMPNGIMGKKVKPGWKHTRDLFVRIFKKDSKEESPHETVVKK